MFKESFPYSTFTDIHLSKLYESYCFIHSQNTLWYIFSYINRTFFGPNVTEQSQLDCFFGCMSHIKAIALCHGESEDAVSSEEE